MKCILCSEDISNSLNLSSPVTKITCWRGSGEFGNKNTFSFLFILVSVRLCGSRCIFCMLLVYFCSLQVRLLFYQIQSIYTKDQSIDRMIMWKPLTLWSLHHGMLQDTLQSLVKILLIRIRINTNQNILLLIEPFLQFWPGFLKGSYPLEETDIFCQTWRNGSNLYSLFQLSPPFYYLCWICARYEVLSSGTELEAAPSVYTMYDSSKHMNINLLCKCTHVLCPCIVIGTNKIECTLNHAFIRDV